MQQFRHVVSLASLAYIFSGIHALQYSLLDSDTDYDMNDNNLTNLQQDASTSQSDFTSFHDTHTSNPANISSSSGKTSGRWTDQEIALLLDYVEAHCPFNSAKGVNLKKTHFNKARDTIKSKDAAQCHYKWNNVCISAIYKGLSYLRYGRFVGFITPSLVGIKNLEVVGMINMVSMHGPQLKKRLWTNG